MGIHIADHNRIRCASDLPFLQRQLISEIRRDRPLLLLLISFTHSYFKQGSFASSDAMLKPRHILCAADVAGRRFCLWQEGTSRKGVPDPDSKDYAGAFYVSPTTADPRDILLQSRFPTSLSAYNRS